MRQDYCPIANEPCQSMCETPCNRKELIAIRKDAERYRFIRSGNVYIEPNTAEIYMATDAGGKYYKDPRDMDMDIDEAISAAMQKGQS